MKHILLVILLWKIFFLSLAAQQIHTLTGSVDTAWVRNLSTGLAPTHWEASKAFTDSFGNVFVSGSAGVVKYSSDGERLWVSKGSPAIGVDPLGCLITAKDLFSLTKHNAAGEILWQNSYSSLSADVNIVRSASIDANGNIYVVGSSGYKINLYDWVGDYVVIKYLPSGDTAWVRTYDGPIHGHDIPSAVCIDAAGNVVVTGSSQGPDSTTDYLTMKYSSSGNLLWVMRHSKAGGSQDAANGMALDNSGNIYITGNTGTIKYSGNGQVLWTRDYPGSAIAIDVNNIVHMFFPDWIDIPFTILSICDTNGTLIVQDTILALHYLVAPHFTMDGSLYLGTQSLYDHHTLLMKFSPTGEILWNKFITPDSLEYTLGLSFADITSDETGNIIAVGTAWTFDGFYDPPPLGRYFSVKLSPAGEVLWKKEYQAKTNRSTMTAFDVDTQGKVYVTGDDAWWYGRTYHLATDWTVGVSPSGNLLWSSRDNLVPDEGGMSAITVGNDGNIYAAGSGFSTIKYTSDGDTAWVRRYNGPGAWFNHANALAVDVVGNVYVTGLSYGSESGADYATIKYTSAGDTAWVRSYSGPGNFRDQATALAVDAGGNVYVTGLSYGSGSEEDYATIKYTSAGDIAWVRRYNGPGNDYDAATALAIDAAGNVYVTGTSSDYADYATIKYTSTGNTVWVRRYKGPRSSYDAANALAVDYEGNVIVTGTSATIKYNPSGDVLWIRQGVVSGNALALDTNGNVFVTGTKDSAIATIKYTSAGLIEWSASYLMKTGSMNSPCGISLDASGNVLVGGSGAINNESYFTIIKYKQSPTSVKDVSHALPTVFNLEQNYPNPFNPSTKIRYQVPGNRDQGSGIRVTVKVYDVLGNQVAVLVDEEKAPGSYEVEFNAARVSNPRYGSGVYFYQLIASDVVNTKKMLLIK